MVKGSGSHGSHVGRGLWRALIFHHSTVRPSKHPSSRVGPPHQATTTTSTSTTTASPKPTFWDYSYRQESTNLLAYRSFHGTVSSEKGKKMKGKHGWFPTDWNGKRIFLTSKWKCKWGLIYIIINLFLQIDRTIFFCHVNQIGLIVIMSHVRARGRVWRSS